MVKNPLLVHVIVLCVATLLVAGPVSAAQAGADDDLQDRINELMSWRRQTPLNEQTAEAMHVKIEEIFGDVDFESLDMTGIELLTRFVPMSPDHLGAVHRIDRLSYQQPWSLALWRQELRHDHSRRRYREALVDDVVVGYSGLMLLAGVGHVSTVAVDPDHRRSGIADALMRRVVDEAIGAGMEALTLEVRVSNTAARELYRQFGFAPSGVRPNYYTDSNEDALIMWRHDLAETEDAATAHDADPSEVAAP